MVESALADPKEFRASSAAYRRFGTRLEVVMLATAETLSQLGTAKRFLTEFRFVSWENHDTCVRRLSGREASRGLSPSTGQGDFEATSVAGRCSRGLGSSTPCTPDHRRGRVSRQQQLFSTSGGIPSVPRVATASPPLPRRWPSGPQSSATGTWPSAARKSPGGRGRQAGDTRPAGDGRPGRGRLRPGTGARKGPVGFSSRCPDPTSRAVHPGGHSVRPRRPGRRPGPRQRRRHRRWVGQGAQSASQQSATYTFSPNMRGASAGPLM
ncbi:zeta toxin family protein [Streptomyces sp. NEAU-Y11]|nr:zeta toxin family protein [Streptomyces sp. NEAU-Y11]